MASKLTKVVANFETSIAAKLAFGATTGSLSSATDKNGAALPAGKYCMIIDRGTGDEEHLLFDLSGVNMTNIKSVSRQGVQTAGVQNSNGHRAGSKCYLTDFVNLKVIVDILNGDDTLDSSNPLKYDGNPTFDEDHQLITKKYVADNYVGVNENDVVEGDYTFNGDNTFSGNNTFQNKIQANGGVESATPMKAADPVDSNDVTTKSYVLALAFGATLISGLNSPEVNFNQRGMVQSVHDVDNGKTYVFIYDPDDVLRAIFDGTSTWAIQYRPDKSLLSVSKH